MIIDPVPEGIDPEWWERKHQCRGIPYCPQCQPERDVRDIRFYPEPCQKHGQLEGSADLAIPLNRPTVSIYIPGTDA